MPFREAALELPDPITTHTAPPAPCFAAPSDSSEMLGVASADTELLADAVNGRPVDARGLYGQPRLGVFDRLLEEEALGQLPAIDKNSFTPMQAFYFRTGIGQSACEQAPDMLLVQGPERFAVDIRANGADIRIGSTAVLTGSQLIAVTGEVVIFPDTPGAVAIPAGHVVSLQFSDQPQSLGIDGQADDRLVTGIVSPPAPLGDQQREQLAVIEDIPAEVVNYAVELDASPEATVESETSPEAAEAPCAPNPEWVYNYTIQSGTR
jgi:hypothetical protein